MIKQTVNTALLQTRKKIPLQQIIIMLVLVTLLIIFSSLSSRFFTYRNLLNIVRQVSYVILAGCAITFLMISGHLDLSIGSAAALSGVTMALLAQSGVPTPIAVIAAVSMGLVVGLFNGLMTARFEIPPFISTLGTMMICRGTALILTNGMTVRNDLPDNYAVLGRGEIVGIPYPFWIMIVFVTVSIILQRKTVLGKYAVAIGGNKTAAELSGINVKKMVFLYYSLVGGFVGFTGAIQSSRLGVGEPNIGNGFEFDVIIAVVLGGTSLAGGEGSVIGMVIGALIVGVIGNGLNLMGVLTFYQSIIKGVILVGAVLLDQKMKKSKA
jgi:ribose/xylose/arabinose/galactoside ABC-type transport system permease subunit